MKYTEVQKAVFGVFALPAWIAEDIKTFPQNFLATDAGSEFIRINVIPSGGGINRSSVSGVLIVDIFTPAGKGPSRAAEIADTLDDYLQAKYVPLPDGSATQFPVGSSLANRGLDTDDKSLFKSVYTIPFSFFGAS